MAIAQALLMAMKNILSSKMRSFLTMLGVIVGVAAVIAIAGMGNGMKSYVKETFSWMGSNEMELNIYYEGDYGGPDFKEPDNPLSMDDMENYVAEHGDSFTGCTPGIRDNKRLKYKKESKYASLFGVKEDYLSLQKLEIDRGRNISYIDIKNKKRVCVIGAFYAKRWFSTDVIGQKISIDGATFEVIGTLKQKGEGMLPEEWGTDGSVLLPYTTLMKMSNRENIDNYKLFLNENADPLAVKKDLEAYLDEILKPNNFDYYVQSAFEIIQQEEKLVNTVAIVLTVIASISLFVGGIGIMNIMLVSVTERTREIGIRKSLGAKNKFILLQFVIEAGATSGFGGLLGIAFGYVLCFIGTMVVRQLAHANITVAPDSKSVILAVAISVFIGVFFGFLPAWKASKLNPIDALRFNG